MKFFLSFLVSFFFICFANHLDQSGVGAGYIKKDKKTAVTMARFVAPHKSAQKKPLHPGSQGLGLSNFAIAVLINRHYFLAVNNYREISNYVSSGAIINQNIASI